MENIFLNLKNLKKKIMNDLRDTQGPTSLQN